MRKSTIRRAAAVAVAVLTATSLSARGRHEVPMAPPFPPAFGQGPMAMAAFPGGPEGAARGFMTGSGPEAAGAAEGGARGPMAGGDPGAADRGLSPQGPGATDRDGGRGPGGPGMPGLAQQPGRDGAKQPTSLEKPLTIDGAAERVEAALKGWGYDDLAVDEVVQYSWAFTVMVREKSTGEAAVELMVDPRTGAVSPGPVMSWNSRYAQKRWSTAPGDSPVSAEEAKRLVTQSLAQSGDTTAWTMSVKEFPGYYAVRLERDGRVEATFSVNALTRELRGDPWWGPFVASKQIKK